MYNELYMYSYLRILNIIRPINKLILIKIYINNYNGEFRLVFLSIFNFVKFNLL